MKQNEDNIINIKDNNINNINNINNYNISNTTKKDPPKFSDILSISSNPEDLFTLLYPIGHGGFGTVYKAIHNETRTIYAIKIIDFIHGLKNKTINNTDIKGGFQNLFFNFNYSSAQQESFLMKLCHKSSYIVNYYGSYYSKKTNTLWLILEYCPAGSVIDLMLSMNRTYTEQEISTIMKNVLKGLILIHSKNLIHRDIKAANIFLSEDGFAKLGDFGVGTKLGIGDFRNSKKGSPYWMSPQVVKNLNYDTKTDIWSLGITCCEMCNGEPPFAELNPQNVMEQIGTHPPKVDEFIKKEEHTKEFYDFVKKCLEVEPKQRPTAKELIQHEFIIKYAKDNCFLKKIIEEHIDDINKFRKLRNELKGVNNPEEKKELNNDNKIIQLNIHHKRNSGSNITSHFNDEIKPNNFKEKENLLIKIISSSSNRDNITGINSTKDSSKADYQNFPTFHKMDDDNNNINDDSDTGEVLEIHDLCKSFDINYFLKENQKGEMNKLNDKSEIYVKEKMNLLLDMNEVKSKINQKYFNNINKKNSNKTTRNKPIDKIFSKKNKLKSRNIINKSSDNLYIKYTQSKINKTPTNFVYVKTRVKKRDKNTLIFKKPIISKNKNSYCSNKINFDELLLDSEDDEGHINNTNNFKAKSNFSIFKNIKKDFSKTEYYFYKSVLRLDDIKLNEKNNNNNRINTKNTNNNI